MVFTSFHIPHKVSCIVLFLACIASVPLRAEWNKGPQEGVFTFGPILRTAHMGTLVIQTVHFSKLLSMKLLLQLPVNLTVVYYEIKLYMCMLSKLVYCIFALYSSYWLHWTFFVLVKRETQQIHLEKKMKNPHLVREQVLVFLLIIVNMQVWMHCIIRKVKKWSCLHVITNLRLHNTSRVRNCTFLVANATKNSVLATRFS